MIKTSERLFKATQLYKEVLLNRIKEYKRLKPNVKYPNEVVRYYFNHLEFSPVTGNLNVYFNVTKYKKRIEYYRQVNYRKIPIYSDVYGTDLKDKKITIKFKNGNHELLTNHEDSIIRDNYKIILLFLGEIGLYPIELQKELIEYYNEINIVDIDNKITILKNKYKSKKMDLSNIIKKDEGTLRLLSLKLENLKDKTNVIVKKICLQIFKKDSFLKSLLSLGILNTKQRLNKYRKKIMSKNYVIEKINEKFFQKIKEYQENCQKYSDTCTKEAYELNELEYLKEIEILQDKFDKMNISYPFFEGKVPSNPIKKESKIHKYTPKYELGNNFSLYDEQLNLFKYSDFSDYKGLQVPGIFIFILNDKKILILYTNDAWHMSTDGLKKYYDKFKYFSDNNELNNSKFRLILPTNRDEAYKVYKEFYDKNIDFDILC